MANEPGQKPHEKEIDSVTGVETTGHDWDGIKELNNPAPRWWLWVWFLTFVFSVGYWIVYPAWPTLANFTGGAFGWSEYAELKDSQAELVKMRAGQEAKIEAATLEQIAADTALYDYARSAGAAVFRNNCTVCHGSGGAGGPGYPALVDDDWMWGGKLADIYNTIRVGVRSTHADTQQNAMPAWGKDGMLTAAEIEEVVEYVGKMNEGEEAAKTPAYEKGKAVYAANCAVCHGDNGEGGVSAGAPRLNDAIWLYGGDHASLMETVTNARAGIMPTWEGRLSDSNIKELAVYVHSLGGGQ